MNKDYGKFNPVNTCFTSIEKQNVTVQKYQKSKVIIEPFNHFLTTGYFYTLKNYHMFFSNQLLQGIVLKCQKSIDVTLTDFRDYIPLMRSLKEI